MDLFDDPETKKTYDKCKLIVKVWEHKFTKKYKRIPSKLDIRESPIEVRHAYRKYFQLKTAALEQSFMDVDGFDDDDDVNESNCDIINSGSQLSNDNFTESVQDELPQCTEKSVDPLFNEVESNPPKNEPEISEKIWGSHLNKFKQGPDEFEKSKKDNLPSKPVQSITKKLFCGSKFNKRNPRKSLSFSQKKSSQNSFASPQFLSQPDTDFVTFKSEEAIAELVPEIKSSLLAKSVNIIEPTRVTNLQPVALNIVDNILESREKKTIKNIDTGWLKRLTENTGISLENPELSSRDFSNTLNSFSDNKSESNIRTLDTKLDYDSDDIIEDSDEEQNTSRNISIMHVAKKSRLSFGSNLTKQASQLQPIDDELSNGSLKENITKNIPDQNINKSTENLEGDKSLLKEHIPIATLNKNITNKTEETNDHIEIKFDDLNEAETPTKTPKVPARKQIKKNTFSKIRSTGKRKKKSLESSDSINLSEGSPSLRRSSRATKVKASFEELSSNEEDPFHSDNDEQDPEFLLEDETRGGKKKIPYDLEEQFDEATKGIKTEKKAKTKLTDKREKKEKPVKKMKKSNQTRINQPEEETAKYELEFNVKPRIVAPRYDSIKRVIKQKLKENPQSAKNNKAQKDTDRTLPKDKRQQAKEKLEQKVASGNLNDNFVTINLKKKVFAKGKKGKNFSKYKKALWKSKKKALYGPDMDMGGCDGGKLVCFNCGQEGHFAQRCKAGKGDGLLPVGVEDEEECPFPTLEEASKMAKDSVLNIRKPKLTISSEQGVEKAKEVQESGGDNEDPKYVPEQKESEDESSSCDEDEWMEDIDSELLLAEVTKLEEYVKKLDVQAYMDNVKVVSPYYQLKEDGNVVETPNEVFEALEKFGHKSFRQGQEKAIMRILSGKSTLVTLSTGSGKSMCYQLPAYLYSQREPCISLVISPLVSLMEDQVTGIPKFLKAACLHTNQTATQRQKIKEALSNGEINVLLISPEAVVAGEKQTGFGSLLRTLPPIAFACIDEAHCVSQWSHNFRPSYLMICRVLRESLGVKTILGLTATATRATCESIVESLNIPDGLDGIISDIPLPDNLHLTVSKDSNRDRALLNLLLSDRFKNCRSIIVYCTRRDECERIASFLRTGLKSEAPLIQDSSSKKRKRLNLQAEPYHAGLSASRRRTVQNAFMSGELRVVVATVAFGMGINKSDIRAVIHFNMPNSFESYVQEVGRAGRDGLAAHCHVFLDSQGRDENELRRHIHANSIDRHVIRKLLQKIFLPCSCKQECPKHEVTFSIEQTVRTLDIPEENISTLLCYLELHENKYIELLNPGYTTCKVISYGGPLEIRKAAKECPPLAMALALYKNNEGKEDNIFEFPIIDVASAMGWESGICKHKMKNLEWKSVNNLPKRSNLSVQFSNLGFRLLAPGNLSDEQLDEALDCLYNRVLDQETKALKQLHAVHKTLSEVAEKSYVACIEVKENEHSDNTEIKRRIREYFNSPDPLANIGKYSPKKICEEQLVNDIRAMICMYRDNQFTGRAIARIFHGIQSPNYPAVIWGRGKFWRSHLNEDFNEICKIATREIIRMK